ncbi:MAG: hypothetical protein VW082_04990 [Candidatus Nanopelagicales bacterium]
MPSASSAVIGLIVTGAVLTVCWIWLPGLVLPLVLLLVAGLAASAAAQAFLGHRGACWGQRTIRWWLGPVGTLLDPFDLG